MQRAASTSSAEGTFWTTIELLAGAGGRRRSTYDYRDDEATPLEQERPHTADSLVQPQVRARLEKLMGSNLVRLTDKIYMHKLQQRIAAVTEENLNKRIAARELDEMERLKRLILVGKTPLNECPPELYNHSVFVFWRLVDREVARASKKRADAYYRKLKAFRTVEQVVEEEGATGEGETTEEEMLSPAELLQRCREELAAKQAADIEAGVRLTDAEFTKLKYETEDVKKLKALTTVDELYKLADQIIGIPRTL